MLILNVNCDTDNELNKFYLNTSYVDIKLSISLYPLSFNLYLNTSYVDIKQEFVLLTEQQEKQFKYILC